MIKNSIKREIAEHVIDLINAEQSLKHVHQFNCFLSDLYKVGFLMRETQSQTDIGRCILLGTHIIFLFS